MKPSTLLLQPNDNSEKIIRNETVSDLVHRHLSDPNHVITDEEIRNARITSSVDEDTEVDDNTESDDNTDNLPQNEELDTNTTIEPPTTIPSAAID